MINSDILDEIKSIYDSKISPSPIAILAPAKDAYDSLIDFINSHNMSTVLIKPNLDKICIKKELNNYKSEILLYNDQFKDVVWEILNDGTTSINDTFQI